MPESNSPQMDEDKLLRTVALQNAATISLARQRAEEALRQANEALEQKTAELAKSLALLRATLEATHDAILVTDAEGNITDYNEQFVTVWRLPPEVMQSRQHGVVLKHNAR